MLFAPAIGGIFAGIPNEIAVADFSDLVFVVSTVPVHLLGGLGAGSAAGEAGSRFGRLAVCRGSPGVDAGALALGALAGFIIRLAEVVHGSPSTLEIGNEMIEVAGLADFASADEAAHDLIELR